MGARQLRAGGLGYQLGQEGALEEVCMCGRSPGLGVQNLHPAQPVLPPSGPWRVVQGHVMVDSPCPTPASISLGPGLSPAEPRKVLQSLRPTSQGQGLVPLSVAHERTVPIR